VTKDKQEARFLVIETSGHAGEVGLGRGTQMLCSRQLNEARRHARDLAPAVADLLRSQNWRPPDIDAVIVSRGPGSYTGLRVGIASAKAFAYAVGCSVIAVETFQAIANQVPADVITVTVLEDAQQGRVYVQRYVREDRIGFRSANTLNIQSYSDWAVTLQHNEWVTGPGLRVHKPPGLALSAPAAAWTPRAASLLSIGTRHFQNGEKDDLWTLEPLYLRASAAEEQLSRRS
jgi:tRNA threonylcarbamoyladenosine biosynthesis protein TsaB